MNIFLAFIQYIQYGHLVIQNISMKIKEVKTA